MELHAPRPIVAAEHTSKVAFERHHGAVEDTVGGRYQVPWDHRVARITPQRPCGPCRTVLPREVGQRLVTKYFEGGQLVPTFIDCDYSELVFDGHEMSRLALHQRLGVVCGQDRIEFRGSEPEAPLPRLVGDVHQAGPRPRAGASALRGSGQPLRPARTSRVKRALGIAPAIPVTENLIIDQAVCHVRWRQSADRHVYRRAGRRVLALDHEAAELDRLLASLVAETAPELLAVYGVGPGTAAALLVAAGDNPDRLRSEAAWAHLCGVAPIEASSGKTKRYHLNRGGDRQANAALWRIVITRMASDPRTQAYVARRTEEGLGKGEIIRVLKRYVAREVYHYLRRP